MRVNHSKTDLQEPMSMNRNVAIAEARGSGLALMPWEDLGMVGLWLREARKHETQGVEEVHLPLGLSNV